MRIKSFNSVPIRKIPFLNAGKGIGSFYVDQLSVNMGQLASLPEDLDAIIATADLQGRERFEDSFGAPLRLLGEMLPERLIRDVLPDLGVSPERTIVILGGDFYTVPDLDRRGGTGDVTGVWQAFADSFKWIVGVPGNHDMFGSSQAPSRRIASNADYLDGESVVVDGLKIAGLGGIIGNPGKPHRKTDQDFTRHLEHVLFQEPDIVVLHDGPDGSEKGQRGSPVIRQTLECHAETLLIRGHAHWAQPLAQLANGSQVLNVDCRVAVLLRSSEKKMSVSLFSSDSDQKYNCQEAEM